jgi:hypothetical protein
MSDTLGGNRLIFILIIGGYNFYVIDFKKIKNNGVAYAG